MQKMKSGNLTGIGNHNQRKTKNHSNEEIAKQIAQSKEKPLNKPKPPFPKNQDIENQDIEKQDIEEQDIEEQDIYNNNSPITNSSNSNSININSHSINQEQEEEKNNLEDKKKAKYNIREIERHEFIY